MAVYRLGDLVPTIAADAFIAPDATVIGNVVIESQASIWHHCTLRGDGEGAANTIVIGARTNIQDNSVVHLTSNSAPTRIGADCLIGHSALLHGCTLDDGAFVGMGAIVLDGAHIESGGMLAAGALLAPGKRLPARQLWAGRPARYVRDLTDVETAQIQRGVAHYVALAQRFRTDLQPL